MSINYCTVFYYILITLKHYPLWADSNPYAISKVDSLSEILAMLVTFQLTILKIKISEHATAFILLHEKYAHCLTNFTVTNSAQRILQRAL
jgi:hypothetical protein